MKKYLKEKIKEHLLVISIIYGIIIILLMLFTYLKMDTNISLNNTDISKEINKYKKQINLIENNKCKTELLNYTNYINENNFKNKTNIRSYYRKTFLSGESILTYYSKIKNSCKITNEKAKEYNLSTMFITATIQTDEIIQTYMYQHEIRLDDFYFRDIAEPSIIQVENQIKKENELNIIKNILKIINENKEVTNEK